MKQKYSQKQILLILIVIISSSVTYAQQKLNVSAGAGVPELFHLGLRYEINENNHLGISVGSFLSKNESAISLSGDFYHHFGGVKNLANRKRTYLRGGMGYLREEGGSYIYKYVVLNFRIGWDFSLSKKAGIQVDLGPGFIISDKEIRIERTESSFYWSWDDNFFIYPSVGLAFYYRL